MRRFLKILQNEHLDGKRVLTDNTMEMFNINKGRTALPLVSIVNSTLLLTELQGWNVETQHILGIMNKEQDSLSRLDRSGDYVIKRNILLIVLMKLKVEVTIDTFATRINTKHRKFCSITKDMWAMARDGHQIN
ncbi:MAG: hypothetical protein EZS28_052669 [Streblomastix strix]|uniref:Uncharacterized protein n=1 Tax=Streblomastix strix TaxID=222440 RepID=A0A5J4RXW2_9EUKA|nr:MAG: hypothetical protein EZS28_052669 [Streblomastix strix]